MSANRFDARQARTKPREPPNRARARARARSKCGDSPALARDQRTHFAQRAPRWRGAEGAPPKKSGRSAGPRRTNARSFRRDAERGVPSPAFPMSRAGRSSAQHVSFVSRRCGRARHRGKARGAQARRAEHRRVGAPTYGKRNLQLPGKPTYPALRRGAGPLSDDGERVG